MDEARSLTYSINVEANTSQAEASIRNITSNLGGLGGSTINIDADTSQAESNIRNVTSGLGGVQTQARSVGSAFRSSFLDGIDSGNSFSSSLRSGVGGAFSYVTGQAKGFVSSVASSASEIGNKFAHPISTIKNGLGNAIQNAKSRFIEMARSAQQAENATGELGDAAGEARRNVSELGDAADDSGGKLSKFGGILKGAGAAIGAVSAAAAAGAVAIGKAVVSAYAEYEQLVGGVDTLFKDASGKVQQYAANAFQTAGMSGNEYMNLVTSFSASLINSLGGDTNLAADVANQAITDMADNANKMGTDLGTIQNAYQGFAKQNYDMLDNLKLGYGGTKTEMERLLADAGKLAGTTFDINSFADVTEAIHVIQTEMGITGTTAKEAAETISGSWASTKAAMQNLFAGLGNENADIGKLVNDVTKNFSNVVKNVTPIVENLASALPEALGQAIPAISGLMPPILEAVAGIFDEVLSSIIGLLPELAPVAVDAVLMIAQTLVENVPVIADAAIQLVNTLDYVGRPDAPDAHTGVRERHCVGGDLAHRQHPDARRGRDAAPERAGRGHYDRPSAAHRAAAPHHRRHHRSSDREPTAHLGTGRDHHYEPRARHRRHGAAAARTAPGHHRIAHHVLHGEYAAHLGAGHPDPDELGDGHCSGYSGSAGTATGHHHVDC